MYYFCFLLITLIQVCSCLHCRDVENKPVDWWVIYKLPGDSGPGFQSGLKFIYITSKIDGRWEESLSVITANDSMLEYTLAPLFNIRYMNYLAVLVYQGRQASYLTDGSSALGLLMGDELGGMWITHTVPDLINLNENAFVYPTSQIDEGHMIMCLSLELFTLNEIGNILRHMDLNIVNFKVPVRMNPYLPHWYLINDKTGKELNLKRLNFLTRSENLHGVVLVRPPGDRTCLYKAFAKNYSTVLDVYTHSHSTNVCTKNFSVRNVDTISVKLGQDDGFSKVWYINNNTDRMGFAVSTAAAWQRRGMNPEQYWTCFGTAEHQPYDFKSGFIVCLNEYRIWLNIDNFKITEPEC